MTVNTPSGYLKLYDVSTSTFSESYKVYFNSVGISEKSNISAKPPLNKSISEVQKIAFENAKITLKGVVINDSSGTLTYTKLKEWYKKTNPDSNGDYLVLVVDYGLSSSNTLIDFDGDSDGIRVVITDYNLDLNMSKDSYNYVFQGSISFTESK